MARPAKRKTICKAMTAADVECVGPRNAANARLDHLMQSADWSAKEPPMNATSRTTRSRLQVEELEQRSLPSTVSYVSSLYTNLLNRTPSVQEEAGWVAQMDLLGLQPAQVTNAFVTSREYLSNVIQNDYQAFLQRAPQAAEVQGWLNQLNNGLGEQQMESAFVGSAEFFALHGGTDSGWVDGVYSAVLGRAADTAGLSYWTGQLKSGVGMQQVALDIVMSPESEARVVSAAYVQLLGRTPDAGGLANWSGLLEHGLSPAQLKGALAASPEYISLQGGLGPIPPPPPSNPTPIDNTPNAPTGNIDTTGGFVDPGAFPTDTSTTPPDCGTPPPDCGTPPPDTGTTIPDPGISIPDPGITVDPGTGCDPGISYDPGSTGDTSFDPGTGF
jgi:hypothetical protein